MKCRLPLFLLMCAPLALRVDAEPQKTSKELFEYIQEARKLRLSDEQIKANALGAGWSQTTIDQTYAIVRMLNNEKPQPGETIGLLQANSLPDSYRIGAGDTLQVLVWKEPDASAPEVVVRADGKVSLPMVKEVDIAGLTPTEAEKALTEKYSRFVREPEISVVPRRIVSSKIYVMGAVRKEGAVALVGPMNVLQALTEAGGLNDYAKRKKIYVLRNENGKQTRLLFNYDAVIKGEQMEQNIQVRAGDTIVVPH